MFSSSVGRPPSPFPNFKPHSSHTGPPTEPQLSTSAAVSQITPLPPSDCWFPTPPPPVCRVVCLQLRISVGRGASRRPQHSCFSFLDIELIRALSLSPTLRSKPVFYALQNLIPSWSIKHVTLDSLLTPRMWSTYQAAVFNQVPSLYQFEVTFSFASANDARADLLCPLLFTGEEVPYVSQICPLVSPVLIILPVPARGIQLTVSITACLFSRFRRYFYSRLSAQHVSKQSNQVSRVQYYVSADFCLCQSRNCPHNCSTVLCVPSYTTLPSLSIVSSGLTLASTSSASQPVHLSLQTSLVTVQSRQASAVGDSLAPYSCTSNSFAASCRSSTHSTDFSVASSVYR